MVYLQGRGELVIERREETESGIWYLATNGNVCQVLHGLRSNDANGLLPVEGGMDMEVRECVLFL